MTDYINASSSFRDIQLKFKKILFHKICCLQRSGYVLQQINIAGVAKHIFKHKYFNMNILKVFQGGVFPLMLNH